VELIQYPLILAAAAVLLLGLLAFLRVSRHRQSIDKKLRRASREFLHDFVIPDGDGGEIHIEYALLTARGVVVLDFKEIDGNVFGSDAMSDWTVLSNRRRFTFSNPQPALYDRLAAIKRLIPDLPVQGYVAFSHRARFSKGQPKGVVVLDQLVAELARELRTSKSRPTDSYRSQWDRLRHEAVTAQFGQLLRE